METITLIVNDAPYGTEKPWNALRLAGALVATKQKVNIFLLGDSAAIAKKGQKTPTGYYNLEQMLGDLAKSGTNIRACGTCLSARGIAAGELVEGVVAGIMLDLARWIGESSKIITF
jgi:uncharacterized protein involved in oxidation of intracellular sulfur